MSSWLPTVITLIGGMTSVLDPQVQAYIAKHPAAAVIYAVIWALLKGFMPAQLQTADKKNLGSALKMVGLIAVFLMLSAPARAQNHYQVGVSFDPSTTPKFKGIASFLTPLDSGNTYSISSALINKPVDGQLTYSMLTGIRRKAPIQPFAHWGIELWVDAQGGPSVSTSATSGAFLGGGAITKAITSSITEVTTGKAYVSPVSGGTGIQVTTELQF